MTKPAAPKDAIPKIGLDDYFLTHQDLSACQLIELDDPIFAELKTQYEDWKNRPANVEDIGFRRRTDTGNGERFALRNRDESGRYLVHYGHDVGWRYFDETHWKIDLTEEIGRRAVQTVRQIYQEAAKISDPDERQKHADWAVASESAAKIKAMITMAKTVVGITVVPDSWDKNPWLLNVKNGTLDLRTGELADHRPSDFISKLIDLDFDRDAECPLWDAFLARVVPNSDDRNFLQKAVGYSLTGSIREECFFILYGTGQNGKSKFLDTLKALFADYAGEVKTEALMEKKSESRANPDIAQLRGLRFVTASENEANRRLATALVKQMTGGGKMRAAFLYQNEFSFTPTHKLWLEVNHKPIIPDTDDGIWRRIRMIPFTVTIPEEERDNKLLDKLLTELPGILAWAIRGAAKWLSEELGWSENIKSTTTEYREESDPLREFLQRYKITPADSPSMGTIRISRADIYRDYEQFCQTNGEKPISPRSFAQRMRERGISESINHGTRFWIGLSLIDESNSGN